jgi:hypothetical protein
MPAVRRDIAGVMDGIPVVKTAVCIHIICLIVINAGCTVSASDPVCTVGHAGYGISIPVMGDFQVFGHPPLVADFNGLIRIAIDIGDRTGLWCDRIAGTMQEQKNCRRIYNIPNGSDDERTKHGIPFHKTSSSASVIGTMNF